MMLSIMGMIFYWIEDVDKWPMMWTLWAQGDDASRSPSTQSVPQKCARKHGTEVNYSATVFFVWLVISLSIFFFSCHYLPFLYHSLNFKALLIKSTMGHDKLNKSGFDKGTKGTNRSKVND
jgi:hypothetical protein